MSAAPPEFIPIKRRAHRRRRGASTSPAPATLEVVGVENVFYDEPVLTFTVVFNTTADAPLVEGVLDPEKWSGVYQGGEMTGLTADYAGFDRILVSLQGAAGAGGASSVSYANDPSDVSDSLGRQLAAFDAFPL
jgi:hypothetical protein